MRRLAQDLLQQRSWEGSQEVDEGLDSHIDDTGGNLSITLLGYMVGRIAQDFPGLPSYDLQGAASSAVLEEPGACGLLLHLPGHWVAMRREAGAMSLLDSLTGPRFLSAADVVQSLRACEARFVLREVPP